MTDSQYFSIDTCADMFKIDKDDVYKKCLSVYMLADDLIEEKYDWLTSFLSPNLYQALKKMKTPVRRGALLRGLKMAMESAFDGAKIQEVFEEDMPPCMSHSARALDVFWVSCPEKKLTFYFENRDMPRNASMCLTEHICFQIGVAFCMDCQIIPPAKLATEYDTFYHTRYPERAKEFEEFAHKIARLNYPEPTTVAHHNDGVSAVNNSEHTKE